MQYLTRFARYNRHTCESRISGIVWINADTFADAFNLAETRRAGMADADPSNDYRIAAIDGLRSLRGTDCNGGLLLWETADELAARFTTE